MRDTPSYQHFLYPPGGILIWLLILIELITFGAGIGAFVWQKSLDPVSFKAGQQALDQTTGLVNTLFLLSSGWLVAEAVHTVKNDNTPKAQYLILGAFLLGLGFILLKSSEYAAKIEAGHDLSSSLFFTFYWLLTGFHFVHVLTGLVILAVLGVQIRRGRYGSHRSDDLEAGAAFWHLCDLIWLLLFPVLYLIK